MCIVVGRLFTTLLAAAAYVVAAPSPSSTSSIDLLMPNVQPTEPDTYLCTAVRIEEAHQYLVGFDPNADSHVAHHILLYGCEEPGMEPGNVWNCGEMSTSTTPTFVKSNVCRSGNNILYAWAMDAPKLNLPPGVAFDVGQDTEVKYLVMQVHYKNVSNFIPPKNGRDSSGLTIHTTSKRMPKQAGVYILVTGGYIPAKSIEYFEAACEYKEGKEIVPFAFRTHAHSLGRVISGYRVRDGKWTEIGRKDPRLPEMFYNVTTPGMTVKTGDILAARCTMEDTTDHKVEIGNTQKDEMCNFYVMYYVDNPPIPSTKQCWTPGPPVWSWKNFEDQVKINLSGVPDTASLIPGTETPLRKTTGERSMPVDDVLGEEEDESLGGETMGVNDGFDADGFRPMEQENFQDPSVQQILSEAINEMNPDELMYITQLLAREEEEEQMRQQMGMQRQRQRERNVYRNYNHY